MKLPTLRVVDDVWLASADVMHVPFFFKVNEDIYFGSGNNDVPCLVDSTRNAGPFLAEEKRILSNILMHHMPFVRKDLDKKVRNSSFCPFGYADEDRKKFHDIRKFIVDKYRYTKVPDYFDVGKYMSMPDCVAV